MVVDGVVARLGVTWVGAERGVDEQGIGEPGAGDVLLAGAGADVGGVCGGGHGHLVGVHGGGDAGAGGLHADGAGGGGDGAGDERGVELGGEQRGGELRVLCGHDAQRRVHGDLAERRDRDDGDGDGADGGRDV